MNGDFVDDPPKNYFAWTKLFSTYHTGGRRWASGWGTGGNDIPVPIFVCPSATRDPVLIAHSQLATERLSYTLNGSAAHVATTNWPHLHNCSAPQNVGYLVDRLTRFDFYSSDAQMPFGTEPRLPQRRHRLGLNILYLDGHVDWHGSQSLSRFEFDNE